MIFNGVLGILLGGFLAVYAGKILDVIGIADNLRQPANDYLKIVSSDTAHITPNIAAFLVCLSQAS